MGVTGVLIASLVTSIIAMATDMGLSAVKGKKKFKILAKIKNNPTPEAVQEALNFVQELSRYRNRNAQFDHLITQAEREADRLLRMHRSAAEAGDRDLEDNMTNPLGKRIGDDTQIFVDQANDSMSNIEKIRNKLKTGEQK